MPNKAICVAVFTGSFGVRGEARVKSFCAEPTAFADYGPLSDEKGQKTYDLTITRPVKGGFAVRVKGVTQKEAADALKGVKLFAERSALPNLPDDEFYHADLIGLGVFDTGGVEIGRVKAVLENPGGDLLEITGPAIEGSKLLPFTMEIVPTIDLTARRIIIDPPPGLLD